MDQPEPTSPEEELAVDSPPAELLTQGHCIEILYYIILYYII